jgi:acetyl esterase/lipase
MTNIRNYLTIFLLTTFCLHAQAQTKQAVITPDKVVIYKKTEQSDLKLEIFNPESKKMGDKNPVIVFFFGGGWVGGTTKQFHQHAVSFAKQGYVAITADYRTKMSPFTCVKDGKSAIRWIRAHAKELRVDPNLIIAAGGSAGGHVATCTAVIDGHEEGANLAVSSKPNGLILYNPVIDTTEKGYGLKKVGEKRKTEISPCHHVRKGIVPTLIFHGTADSTVPFENVEHFTKLMKLAGNNCTLIPFEKEKHGFFNGSYFRATNDDAIFMITMKESLKFLKVLKSQKSE